MRWQRVAVSCGALAVLIGTILMGCTDGVTPDCSDAATQCGPDIDGSFTPLETSVVSEASLPEGGGDSSVDGADGADGATDAPNDSDAALDAGDAG
jgi:hypothetical protein